MRKVRIVLVSLTAMLAVPLNPAQAGVGHDDGSAIIHLDAGLDYTPAEPTGGPATWTGTAECVRNCEGSFNLIFEATSTSPDRPGSCVPMTATVTIKLVDPTTGSAQTVASNLSARSHGTKELAFSGVTDRTDTLFSSARIRGTAGYPESASKENAGCAAGSSIPLRITLDTKG